jgi:hypothetical protein
LFIVAPLVGGGVAAGLHVALFGVEPAEAAQAARPAQVEAAPKLQSEGAPGD